MYLKVLEEINSHSDSIYVVKDELKNIIPLHKHPQSHILVVLDGVAKIDIDQTAYYIPNGFFVWIPSNVSHRVLFDSAKITILNIYYPQDKLVTKCTEEEDFFSTIGVYLTPSLLFHTFEIFKNKSIGEVSQQWQIELLTTMKNILPHIINSNINLRLPISHNKTIQKIIKIIKREYRNNLTAKMLGEEVGMSVRTLDRYFAKELNTSFYQYLKMYRMVEAIKLLVKKDVNIEEVAYNVGYDSTASFSNAFLKVTGFRPSNLLKDDMIESYNSTLARMIK